MTLPFAYTLGIVVLVLARYVFFVLPGSGNAWLAALGLCGMALPALLTTAAGRARTARRSNVLARLAPALLPSLYALLLAPCGWLDLADSWAGDSHLVWIAMLLAPLALGEVARVVAEVRWIRTNENLASGWPLLRPRLAFLLMFSLPWVALALLGDLLRETSIGVFLLSTNTGMTIGTLAFAVGIGVLLPLVFRFAMGLSRRLPEPGGTELRATAAALGFRGSAVLLLETGMRTVNALMIGPLPWPRYLVLTDGLVAILDVHALRGVVAHEVGHAQAGHPAMLLAVFVVSPLLLASAGQHVSPTSLDFVWKAAIAVSIPLAGWWALRRISHRFEHEADVLSAIALGGAEPCIRALTRVGEIVQGEVTKATTLHPSERDRVELLRRFAAEPEFRARFALRGLHLRRAIVALLVLSLGIAAWGVVRAWPCERAFWLFGTGRLEASSLQARSIGSDLTEGQLERWTEFVQELDAACAIVGAVDADWDTLRDRLAEGGWQRGVAALVANGGAAARPWMVLATEDRERSPLRQCVRIYCEAAAAADLARMDEVAAHLRGFDLPPELRKVFGP